MVTNHAIERYIQRVMNRNNPTKEINEEDFRRAKDFLVDAVTNSKEFYKGFFCTKDRETHVNIYKNLILIIKGGLLATVWEVSSSKDLIKDVNRYRYALANLEKTKKDNTKRCLELKGAKEFFDKSSVVDINVKFELEKEIDKIFNEGRVLKLEIEALELLISYTCYKYTYNRSFKNKCPISFFVGKQGNYNEKRVSRLVEGLEILKKEGVYNEI